MNYAISISGFNHELVIRPFISIPVHLDFFVMLTTDNEKSGHTCKKVKEFLSFAKVETVIRRIVNIYDFYEVYIALELIKMEYGLPDWINVSAGPGIAISALTFFALNNQIPVVSFSVDQNKTSIVDVSNSKNMLKYLENGINILEALSSGEKSLTELSKALQASKSTVSRNVSKLEKVSLVKTRISGRILLISLSPSGLNILDSKYKKRD